MCHELRKLMAAADANRGGPLKGHVEIDETIVGGRAPRESKMAKKVIVMGMVERGGRIVAGPVPDTTKQTLEPIILENVAPETTVSTDDWGAYSDLGRVYTHGTVVHSAKEYVRGIHHVNTLEGHWGLFKRAVKGTHVHISSKHAWKY